MRALICSLIVVCGAVVSSSARGDFVVSLAGSVSQISSGAYLYEYTMVNSTTSNFSVLGFGMIVGSGAHPESVVGPDNWDFYDFDFGSFADYIGWETGDPGASILPGATWTFSFVSVLAPGIQAYTINGLDVDDMFNGETIEGSIVAPSLAVPEPSPLTLLCIGSLAVVAARGCSLQQWISDSLSGRREKNSCP